MKLKFDPSLEFQQDAMNAVVAAFDGQPMAQSQFEISASAGGAGMALSDLGVGNQLTLSDDEFLANVQKIQEANDIPATGELLGREFSVEMETGTGKTYVYLRTIFELNKKYGLKKFVIVVPSVAIREGVLKSIDVMREHFQAIYGNVPFDPFVYDSNKLGKVRQFATSNQIQIMIINVQSFVKDVPDKDTTEMTEDELKKLNVINRENDKMSGRKPIEFIQSANPVVIIDEPQSVDNTPKAKGAIARLNPIATLRYSATHKNPYNLLYKLDPTHIVGIESKRYEPFRGKHVGNFSEAYWRPVWGERMAQYEAIRDGIAERTIKFERLDAAQLVKHAFGLRTEGLKRGKSAHLLYLYAEPTQWSDGKPVDQSAIENHRDDVQRFAEIVSGDEVGFSACTYKSLLEKMKRSSNAGVVNHATTIETEFRP